jgi:hypothetical protein
MKRSLIFLSLYLISTLVVAEPYPWELLKDRKFREPYYAMLGKKTDEKWLSTLLGPAEPAKKVTILDVEYLFIHSCKPHDCDSHNIVIIYSPTSFSIYGKLVEEGVISKLGNPGREISAALDRLYDDEFGTTN